MNKSFAEVREDDVIKIFQSMPFRRSLRQAAAFTKQTGYESGLLVVRDLYNGSYYASRMRKGTTENFYTEDINYDGFFDFDFGEQHLSPDRYYRFLDLHFHPYITGCPEPSCLDLLLAQEDCDQWSGCEDVDTHPIIAVAHVLEDDRIIALLYQKSIKNDIEIERAPILDKIENDLLAVNLPDSSYIVGCLEKSGFFYADMLILEKRRHYSPNKKDYAKLRCFAYTPRRRATTGDSTHQTNRQILDWTAHEAKKLNGPE